MKKRLILGMAFWASLQCGMAQSLEKMQWFNEPEQWKIENLHIPADTRSAFPVISVQSPVGIQCCWQS